MSNHNQIKKNVAGIIIAKSDYEVIKNTAATNI